MRKEALAADQPEVEAPILSVGAYERGPVEAFDTVAAHILAEARDRGLIALKNGELADAIDILNQVGAAIDGKVEHADLDRSFAFLEEMHQTREFADEFSLGLEARADDDGTIRIWRPD
jgi:hypothetical protein